MSRRSDHNGNPPPRLAILKKPKPLFRRGPNGSTVTPPALPSLRYSDGKRRATTVSLAPRSFNEDERTFEAVVATEYPFQRWGDAREILRCDAGAVDVKLLRGAPLIDTHDRFSIDAILGVVEDAWISDRTIVARIRISASAKGKAAADHIREGTISKVSIGYRVLKASEVRNADGSFDVTVERWEPQEVSLVSVPADPNARIRSATKENGMDPEDELDTIDGGHEPAGESRTRSAAPPRSQRIERQIERIRSQAIDAGLAEADVDELLEDETDVNAARRAVFDALATRSSRQRTGPRRSEDRGGGTGNIDDAIVAELAARMGGNPPSGDRPFAGRHMIDIGRSYFESRGVSMRSHDSSRIADMMIGQESVRSFGSHTTSDFPSLMIAGGQRALADRFSAYATPLKSLSRQRNVRDFRKTTIIRPGEAPALKKVSEEGEIEWGTTAAAEMDFQIESYARAFALSRKAVVNDDLGAFADFTIAFAQSAVDREAIEFFSILSANSFAGATMKDGLPLFHADRGNLAGSGAAINVPSISAARQAMRTRKNVNGTGLAGVAPAVLVVGPALETVAEQYVGIINAADADNVNPFSGKLRVVVENQYDGNGWWLFADPVARPAFTHGYLEGRDGPQIRTDELILRPGLIFVCELDFGCAPYDWRAGYFNPGVD